MSTEIHPFHRLSQLIDKFNSDRNNLDLSGLQELRENIALTLFYLSDDASKAISNYDAKDYERKRVFAEKEEFYRNAIDERTNKKHNVADSERLARLCLKQIEDETVVALRQKERVRLIISATNQILNSLSGRITQLSK